MRPAEGRPDAPDAGTGPESVDQPPAPAAEVPSLAAGAETVPARDPASETRQVPAPTLADTHETLAQTTPDIAAQTDVPPSPAQTENSPPAYLPEATIVYQPSPEVIAACRANPEAMAALNAGDAERFARAMGIDNPSEAYLAAAARPGSPFDRQASGSRTPGPGAGK